MNTNINLTAQSAQYYQYLCATFDSVHSNEERAAVRLLPYFNRLEKNTRTNEKTMLTSQRDL